MSRGIFFYFDFIVLGWMDNAAPPAAFGLNAYRILFPDLTESEEDFINNHPPLGLRPLIIGL